VELEKEPSIEQHVLNVLMVAAQSQPECLLLAFSKLPYHNAPHQDVITSLVVLFIQGHANTGVVLPILWQTAPSLLVMGCLVLYANEPSSLSRILDLAQEIKILPQILETKPFNFSIDLAALASRREYLNLEKWLLDHIKEEGTGFLVACLEFLREKVTAKLVRQEKASVPLSLDVAAIFLRILFSQKEYISFSLNI
jgi:CCR4-NOT transcription complex subunit 1